MSKQMFFFFFWRGKEENFIEDQSKSGKQTQGNHQEGERPATTHANETKQPKETRPPNRVTMSKQMLETEWEDIELRAISMLQLCLLNNVINAKIMEEVGEALHGKELDQQTILEEALV